MDVDFPRRVALGLEGFMLSAQLADRVNKSRRALRLSLKTEIYRRYRRGVLARGLHTRGMLIFWFGS